MTKYCKNSQRTENREFGLPNYGTCEYTGKSCVKNYSQLRNGEYILPTCPAMDLPRELIDSLKKFYLARQKSKLQEKLGERK